MRLRTAAAATLVVAGLVGGASASSSAVPAPASSSTAGASASSAPNDNAVVHWSQVAEAAISANPTPPPPPAAPGFRPPASSTVLAGMVHGAMYDAVASVLGGLKPFATAVRAPEGSSADAAVGQAARDVLVVRVPGQAANVQAAYDAFMAGIPDGAAKTAGKAVGAAVAAGMLAWRTGDHFDDVVPYVQQTPGPGVFEPIAPTTPVDTKLPYVRPFTYSGPKYRPEAPYRDDLAEALTTRRYARDVAELKMLGGATGSSRSPEQTETAFFHSAPTYLQFSQALRALVTTEALDLRESARLLGYTWVATGDTMIACWDAKYHYRFWRPNHAIQRADTDGNPATTPDATWLPLITGNHPEYASGHACITAAVSTSLEQYFGTDRVELTLPGLVPLGGPARTYQDLDDLVEDVENARVWGGLHFRTTMVETAKHFPRIAKDVGKRYFLQHRR
jgi:hypothetical protein